MNVELYWLLPTVAVLCALFLLIGWFIASRTGQTKFSIAEDRAREILEAAQKEAEHIKKEKLLEVKDEWFRKKQEVEKELNRQRSKVSNREKQLNEKDEALVAKLDLVTRKEQNLTQIEERFAKKEALLDERIQNVNQVIQDQTDRLERVAGLSRDDARKMLIENMTNDARRV